MRELFAEMGRLLRPTLILLMFSSGCGKSGRDNRQPAPPADDSTVNVDPSPDHLRTDAVIRSWGKDPVIEWDAVITLAELSKLAYDDAPTRKRELKKIGFDDVHLLDSQTNSGFVATTNDVAVIAFRGTDTAIDWITNVDIRQLVEMDGNSRLHAGFRNAYNEFKTDIRGRLRKARPRQVWVTGHSLGGAMAACCAYDLENAGISPTGVVTFGQPRIGNQALADFLNEKLGNRYLRLMNEGDPVPMMPPCFGITLPAYWHSGRRAWLLWGQLFTTEGPTRYAGDPPGPGRQGSPGGGIDEPEGKDEFRSMTEGEFTKLQEQLRAARAHDVPGGPAPTRGGTPQQPMPAQTGAIIEFFRARIGEHDMDEYLRNLNSYRRKTIRRSK